MTIEEILQSLTVVEEGTFPEAAILAAREHKEEIIPHLLQALSVSPEELDNIFTEYGEKDETYWLFDFAAYLLAEFRVHETFPLLVDFFSTPVKLDADVTEDFVTDSLSRVWASTFNTDIEALFTIIQNKKIDIYIREAATEALVILQKEGMVDREQVIGFCLEYITQNAWENKEDAWDNELEFADFFVSQLTRMKSTRLKPYLEKMFDDELVDPSFISRSDMERTYSEENVDRIPNLITDAVTELKDWSYFKTEAEIQADRKHFMDKLIKEARAEEQAERQRQAIQRTYDSAPEMKPVGTYQRAAPKVGRNDPCPCGSGKKYKKCCMGK